MDEYGRRSIDDKHETMWVFEPHVAEEVFEDYVREFAIPVFREEQWLDRESGIEKSGAKRSSPFARSDGNQVSPEKSLSMQRTKAICWPPPAFRVPRRPRRQRRLRRESGTAPKSVCCITITISAASIRSAPIVVPGDPGSGVLPTHQHRRRPVKRHDGDRRVQAYCFRMCLTDDPGQPSFHSHKPDGYDAGAVRIVVTASLRGRVRRHVPISSIRCPTARPTRTTMARSAPTISE